MKNSVGKGNGLSWKYILNKVPEVTIFFWIIKVLGTTVGETAADFLNVNLNFGLTGTSIVTGILLLVALIIQFKQKKYIPWVYWTSVVLISIFGTLVTDNLTDALGVPLEISTIIFSILLVATFTWWYVKEKTLSIHSITTSRREFFYWLTILFTFALGTASGDLMAEALGLGYSVTGIIIVGVIALLAIAWRLGLDEVLSFWLIYIFTRPLGASIGDFLSQPHKYGGLGLGATVTSALFVGAIIILVVYLAISKKDVTKIASSGTEVTTRESKKVTVQTIVTIAVLIIPALIGYHIRSATLPTVNGMDNGTNSNTQPLGDLSSFKAITTDTLNLANQGDLVGAKTRAADLEHEWDASEAKLKPLNKTKWTEIDGKIDTVLRNLRSTHPNVASCKSSLETLLLSLNQ